MKRAMLTLVALGLAAPAWAGPPQGIGLGIIAGNPTGLTGKVFSGDTLAYDVGVGFSGDAAIYADALWHSWDMLPKPNEGLLGAYAGLGPRFETKKDLSFGIRTMAGAAYYFARHPIELFAELGPAFQLTPSRAVGLDGGLGLRVYFGGKGGV